MSGFLFRCLILAGLLTAPLIAMADTRAAAGKPGVPGEQKLEIMIKSTLLAYNHGNVTGNYAVLRDLAAPVFRESNSPTRLAEIFRDLRERDIDISPILLFEHTFSRKPEVDKDGDLLLQGYFDTRPERVEFFLVYRLVRGTWRLLAIKVATRRPPETTASLSARTDGSSADGARETPEPAPRAILKKGDALIGPDPDAGVPP